MKKLSRKKVLSTLLGMVLLQSSCCGLLGCNKVFAGDITIENKAEYDSFTANKISGEESDGKVNGNTITINDLNKTGLVVDKVVRGAYGNNKIVSDNKVHVDGVTFNSMLYGGNAFNEGAVNNSIEIVSGEFNNNIYGAYVNGYKGGDLEGNSVYIINGDFTVKNIGTVPKGIIGGHNEGASNSANVKSNSVTIDNGTFGKDVNIYGGYNKGKGDVIGNKVIINNGVFNSNIYSGYGFGESVVKENVLEINNGTFKNIIYGAVTEGKGSIDGNKIIINGGTFENTVYASYGNNSKASSINNIVYITGGNFDKAMLYGRNPGSGVGNTLVIDGWSGKVKAVERFQNINFEKIAWKNNGVVMEITQGNTSNALKDTKINLNGISFTGGVELDANEKMTIIKAPTSSDIGGLSINLDNVGESEAFTAGVAAVGTGKASLDGENLVYTIESVGVNPQVNMLSANYAATAAFVNQSTDLLVDTLDGLSVEDGYGIKTFAAVYGNRSEYDVDNELKINGWSSLVGIGNTKAVKSGDFSWGVFYENGSGNYRTYNSFKDEFFRGDGNVVYNGGGVAAKLATKNGVYYEGSLRAGMLKNEMSNALKDASGANYNYKAENNYYGGHIGVGRLLVLDNDREFEIYGRFYHTKTNGDNFMVSDDAFALGDITSNRLRIGGRLRTNTDAKWNTYYGLAWEYEFDGEAELTAQGMAVPAQSLQGSTFIGELGVNYVPSKKSPWSFDAKVRGFSGQREGFSGNIQVNYGF